MTPDCEKWLQRGPHDTPTVERQSGPSGELRIAIGEPTLGKGPRLHEKQQIGTMLLCRKVKSVRAIIADEQREVGKVAHGDAPVRLLAASSMASAPLPLAAR